MIHALIIILLLALGISILRYCHSHIRFNRLLYQVSPQVSASLSDGRSGYFASGKCIGYCLAGEYRKLNDDALSRAGDRLARDHRCLIPLIVLLIFLVSILIVFSSDPGPKANLWQWP